MVNLTHFTLVLGGVTFPPAEKPLVFEPITAGPVGGGDVPALFGYNPPAELADLPRGSEVIVPRFAPAIGVALERGLEAFCIPLEHTGQRGKPGGGDVVLGSVDSLEPAPRHLAVEYPTQPLPEPPGPIARAVKGAWPIKTAFGAEWPPVEQGTVDYPDGSALLPPLPESTRSVIVPHSGPCVRAALAAGLTPLVTGVLDRATGTVPLYRVG